MDRRPPPRRALWRELPILLILAVAAALLIKTFVLQAFFIPSGSMRRTLVAGDRVLVEKLTYLLREPARGDILVFERDLSPATAAPDQPPWVDVTNAFRSLLGFPTEGNQDYIKRVMAVGGDVIEGREGAVFVNGKRVQEPYVAPGATTSDFAPVDVPEGFVFVMGDNRGHSEDSRIFGPVDVEKVVGHAFLLVWPPQDFDTL